MPLLDVTDGQLHYEIIGEGEPLLLVSGLSGIGSYWAPQLADFSSSFQVVVHDQRGTGRSSKSDILYSVEQMADDVVRLMDGLSIQRASFLGHSTGGAIGQVIAAKYPDRLRALILCSSWAEADIQMRLCFDVRGALLKAGGARAYAHASPLFLYPPWYNAANAELLVQDEERAVAGAPPDDITRRRIEAIMAFDGRSYLPRITSPCLVVCARDDILTPPHYSETMAASISGAELVMLGRGAHAMSRTVPAEFNALILEFLNRNV